LFYDYDDFPEIPEAEERPRDHKIDEAKQYLLKEVFGNHSEEVFYGRQIEVMVERTFFHWITNAALAELVAEGKIQTKKLPVRAGLEARFYWSKGVRYWKREANKIVTLIRRYSVEEVSRAIGDHGELMFDAALPRFGFMPVAWNTQEYKGRKWTTTGHNLDRVFERDEVGYGAEIKNTLDYIEREELESKIGMCKELGIRPLFILRFAPKNYIDMIIKAGGYAMIFEWQLYPPGFAGLAKELKETLRLKVDTPRRISDGTIQKFLLWHRKQMKGG